VYVYNRDGSLTSDEQARIQDAITAFNDETGGNGVTRGLAMALVTDPTQANIILENAPTTRIGGQLNGVLGDAEMMYAPSTSNQTANGNPYLQLSGYVTVNIVEGWNWYTGVNPALIGSNQYDYQTVVTHELSHAVGLYHDSSTYVGFNDDNHSVMYPSLGSGLTRRNFSVYDYNWLQYLYASAAYPGSNGVPEQVDPQAAEVRSLASELLQPIPAITGSPFDETTAAASSASERAAAPSWREVVDTASPGERFIKADFWGAMAGVRASVEDPHLHFDVNLVGTLNPLEAARGHRLGDFVFASSSSTYGNSRCLLMAPSWSFLSHGLASVHTDWIHGLEPWTVSGLDLHWQAAPGPGS
jgi:hypothetical protein